MKVAIIPARGGSKRIPRKNIKIFAGKPIIAYSIEAATRSKLFDRIIVSTDSSEIAETAKHYGAEAPFSRPASLSDDFTPTAPVLAHALDWLTGHKCRPDYACCIYATAPFLTEEYLCLGDELLSGNKASGAFSVTTYPSSIFRSLRINQNGRLEMFWPEYELTRSNDLPEAYHDAGQFYWVRYSDFLREKRLYSPDAVPIIMPRKLVQDIDTPEDWLTAEAMYEVLRALGEIGPKNSCHKIKETDA